MSTKLIRFSFLAGLGSESTTSDSCARHQHSTRNNILQSDSIARKQDSRFLFEFFPGF